MYQKAIKDVELVVVTRAASSYLWGITVRGDKAYGAVPWWFSLLASFDLLASFCAPTLSLGRAGAFLSSSCT